MKSLKQYLSETYSNGVLDKSVKASERKKVYNAIYTEIEKNGTTGHLYRDNNWNGVSSVSQDVQTALDKLNAQLDDYIYEVTIASDDGGYRKSNDGLSQWKQYKVELFKLPKNMEPDREFPEPFMIGTLNCHAAGSIEDPFEAYDMSFCISY